MTLRAILVTARPRERLPNQDQILVNLLQTTLASQPAAVPFRQLEWPNPLRRSLGMAQHAFFGVSYYEPPVQAPFLPLDLTPPVLARKVQQPDNLVNYLLTPLTFTPPIPRVMQEFQNPVLARRVQPPPIPIPLLQTTLFTIPPVPTFQFPWENPKLARRVQTPEVFPNLTISTLFVPDGTPDAFSFTAQFDIALITLTESNEITIQGINIPVDVSMGLSGEYSQNGAAYTAVPGIATVNNGDTFRVRQTSSASYSTLTSVTLTVGGVSASFNITTLAAPGFGLLRRAGGRIVFEPKQVGETLPRYFDFTGSLGEGETLVSAVTTATLYTGVDPDPSDLINGAAAISGARVSQSITGGVAGAIYLLTCTAVTDEGDTVVQTAYQAIKSMS